MARGTLSVNTIAVAGITPSYTAGNSTDHHQFLNDGNTFLHVKNTGSQITVTIDTPATISGMAIADAAVVIPATTGDKMIGPFDPSIFNQTGGYVYVDLSGQTGVTLAAIKLP